MCDLCSSDSLEREKAISNAKYMSDQLSRLADAYGALAHGRLKPHTDALAQHASLARNIVRKLVEDWV